MHVYIYIYITTCLTFHSICSYARPRTDLWCANMYVYIYIYIYVYIYMCIYIYICSYLFMCIYTYIHIYIYTYTHIHTCIATISDANQLD